MVILAVFTPSSQTCEKMLISSVVTHENVESTKEDAKEFVDYLFEKIEELETNNIPKE
jgi:nucleoid DNA-binding protein